MSELTDAAEVVECDHEAQFFDNRWRCLRCGDTLLPFVSVRGYCQQEHVEGDVTYWCELRERHAGVHRSGSYEWARAAAAAARAAEEGAAL